MKKLDKIALVFLVVYLACWIADSTDWVPNLKPYAKAAGHVCVLLFLIYLFVDEKTRKSNSATTPDCLLDLPWRFRVVLVQ